MLYSYGLSQDAKDNAKCLSYKWYHRRVILFAIVLVALLMAYEWLFFTGNPLGSSINRASDTIVSGISHAIGVVVPVIDDDALIRTLTLGPVSVVLFLSLLAFLVSYAVSLVVQHDTRPLPMDDGHTNIDESAEDGHLVHLDDNPSECSHEKWKWIS